MKSLFKKITSINNLGVTIIYTLGHLIIASACNIIITGASLNLATLDAIVEPLINGIWFYTLQKWYTNYYKK